MNRLNLMTALALALPAMAMAGTVESRIEKAVTPVLGASVEAVNKSPYAGLYEVVTPRGIAYTDKEGKFLIFGATVVDVQSRKNLSEQRLNELGAFKFADLPLADAVKTVYGDGSRVLVTIEDPNCGYCKRLDGELAKVKNVTIYTLLYPILAEDSLKKSQAVWCAPNRSQAWTDHMINGKALPEKVDCDTPIERNVALARKLRVMGTPALLFPSGERVPGAISAEQIETKLAERK